MALNLVFFHFFERTNARYLLDFDPVYLQNERAYSGLACNRKLLLRLYIHFHNKRFSKNLRVVAMT